MHDTFWDEAARESALLPARNVPTATPERLVTAGAGAALVWLGLTRRGLLGSLAAATGSALLVHGAAPRSRTYGMLGVQPRTDGSASLASPIHFRETVTIGVEPAEAYRRWRRLEDLPTFMRKVESVEVLDDRRSRWTVTGPGGRSVEWEAEITEDRAGEYLAWRTIDEGPLQHEGSVRFVPAPGGRGTRAMVEMAYHPRGGVLSAAALMMLGSNPKLEAREDLHRFKQILETGEVANGSSPSARGVLHSERHNERGRGRLHRETAAEQEEVDEALIETFPASDPPAFTPGTA